MALVSALPIPSDSSTTRPPSPAPLNKEVAQYRKNLCIAFARCTTSTFQIPHIVKILAVHDRCVKEVIPAGGHKINGKDNGIPRSLLVTNSHCIALMTRTKKGDVPLYLPQSEPGKSPATVVKTGVDLTAAEKAVVKVTRKALCQPDELVNVRRECNLLEKLRGCRGVVQFKCTVETDDKIYLAQEFCNRGELFDALTSGELSFAQRIDLTRQFLNGLREIHEKEILHRDLKPENLFLHEVDDNLLLKIGDFGLSCDENDNAQKKAYCGSYHWLPPEKLKVLCYPSDCSEELRQAKWIQKTTRVADIYQAGVILFLLLIEKPRMFAWQFPLVTDYDDQGRPYQREETNQEFLRRVSVLIASGNLQKFITIDIERETARLDPKIENILKRMLNVDPSKRPTIQQLCEDFVPIFEGYLKSKSDSPQEEADLMFRFDDDALSSDTPEGPTPSPHSSLFTPLSMGSRKTSDEESGATQAD